MFYCPVWEIFTFQLYAVHVVSDTNVLPQTTFSHLLCDCLFKITNSIEPMCTMYGCSSPCNWLVGQINARRPRPLTTPWRHSAPTCHNNFHCDVGALWRHWDECLLDRLFQRQHCDTYSNRLPRGSRTVEIQTLCKSNTLYVNTFISWEEWHGRNVFSIWQSALHMKTVRKFP